MRRRFATGLTPHCRVRTLVARVAPAVDVARAKRIGHGVDIAYERDAAQLLATMRERDVLVEICLTSNDVILGVSGAQHPFPDYVSAGVPVTLATDDPGMFHTDLDAEYRLCHEVFGMGIPELADIARAGARAAYCSAELRGALLAEIDEVAATHA